MIRLLILRVVPLVLRPAVVLLEGALIADGHILVMALPVAMMALTISSVPVHLDYFKSQSASPDHSRLANEYVSGLSWLCLIGVAVLAPSLVLLPLELTGTAVASICLVFLTEKLSDETSRALEFRKAFVKWFLVQIMRSGWLAVPIVLSLGGVDYLSAFLLMSVAACIVMLIIYRRVLGLAPRLSGEGFRPIRRNLIFLAGTFLPASYQQLPRILIAKFFPEQAHVFLATAQVAQGVGLIFIVRYQIPYRRIITRKPRSFQRHLKPVMFQILFPSAVIAFAYLFLPAFIDISALSDIALAVLLVPVLIANALTLSILSAHLGYLQWFAAKLHVLVFYLVSVAIAALAGVLVIYEMAAYVSLPGVPAVTMTVGFAWIFLIIAWFFPKEAKDV